MSVTSFTQAKTVQELIKDDWLPGVPHNKEAWAQFEELEQKPFYMFSLTKLAPGCCGKIAAIRYMLTVRGFMNQAGLTMTLRSHYGFNFMNDGYQMIALVKYPSPKHFAEVTCSKELVDANPKRKAAFVEQVIGPVPLNEFLGSPTTTTDKSPSEKMWDLAQISSAFGTTSLFEKAKAFFTDSQFKSGIKVLTFTAYVDGDSERPIADHLGEFVIYRGEALVGGALAGTPFKKVVVTTFPSKHDVLTLVHGNQDASWLRRTYFSTVHTFDGAA